MTSPQRDSRRRITRSTRHPSLRDASSWVALGALAAVLLEGSPTRAQETPHVPPAATPTALFGDAFLEVDALSQSLSLDRWRGSVLHPNERDPALLVLQGDLRGTLPLFGIYFRGGAYVRPWLYLATQVILLGGAGGEGAARPGAPALRSATRYGVGVAAGLHLRPAAQLSVRLELGADLVATALCFLSCPVPHRHGELTDFRVRLEPRAAVDLQLSPTIALGVFGGTDLLLPEEWTAGLSLRLTPAPIPAAVPSAPAPPAAPSGRHLTPSLKRP